MADPALPVVGQVVELPIAHIVVGERLRPVDPVWAAALGKVMSAEGQDTPILVSPIPGDGYRLVAGAHRLEGARLEGWTAIKAIVADLTEVERRAREVGENLWRRDLNPIDRAAFVAEFHELLRARAGVGPQDAPQSIAAQARWKKELGKQADDASAMIARAYDIGDEAAEAIGLSRRTIFNDLALHRGILPGLAAQLRGLPIARNAAQLRALARMPEADQRAVVALLVEGKAKGATDALGILQQKPKADPEKKAWSAFLGGWARLNGRRRREALRELADMGLPPGVRIVFDEDDNG